MVYTERKPPRALSSAQFDIPEDGANYKRVFPTMHDRIMILDWIRETGSTQVAAVEHFKYEGFPLLRQSTISRWIKNEKELRERAKTKHSLREKRIRFVRDPEFERLLKERVLRDINDGVPVTDKDIAQYGTEIYDSMCVMECDRLTLKSRWISCFKERNDIKTTSSYTMSKEYVVDSSDDSDTANNDSGSDSIAITYLDSTTNIGTSDHSRNAHIYKGDNIKTPKYMYVSPVIASPSETATLDYKSALFSPKLRSPKPADPGKQSEPGLVISNPDIDSAVIHTPNKKKRKKKNSTIVNPDSQLTENPIVHNAKADVPVMTKEKNTSVKPPKGKDKDRGMGKKKRKEEKKEKGKNDARIKTKRHLKVESAIQDDKSNIPGTAKEDRPTETPSKNKKLKKRSTKTPKPDTHLESKSVSQDIKIKAPAVAKEDVSVKEIPKKSKKRKASKLDMHLESKSVPQDIKIKAPAVAKEDVSVKEIPKKSKKRKASKLDMHLESKSVPQDIKIKAPAVAKEDVSVKEIPKKSKKRKASKLDMHLESKSVPQDIKIKAPAVAKEDVSVKEIPKKSKKRKASKLDMHLESKSVPQDIKIKAPAVAKEDVSVKEGSKKRKKKEKKSKTLEIKENDKNGDIGTSKAMKHRKDKKHKKHKKHKKQNFD